MGLSSIQAVQENGFRSLGTGPKNRAGNAKLSGISRDGRTNITCHFGPVLVSVQGFGRVLRPVLTPTYSAVICYMLAQANLTVARSPAQPASILILFRFYQRFEVRGGR